MAREKEVTLITGGCRSGKSTFALQLAQEWEAKTFIATAEPLDEEIRARIQRHRASRGSGYETIEEPRYLDRALKSVTRGVCVIDCLTGWVGNLMKYRGDPEDESYPEIDALIEALRMPPCEVILVTHELGMGMVPGGYSERKYRDVGGRMNQRIAALSQAAYLCVSGLPVRLK